MKVYVKDIVGVFTNEKSILAATRAARHAGWRIRDAFVPYPVHGLDTAMGVIRTNLPVLVFFLGCLAGFLKIHFQLWSSAVDWPLNIGGKPWNSIPAFVPVTFEIIVLISGCGGAFALLFRCGLFPGRRAKLVDIRQTDDRFILVLAPPGPDFTFEAAEKLLREHDAVEVRLAGETPDEEIEEEESA